MALKRKVDWQTGLLIGKCIALGLALILSEVFSCDLFGAMLNAFVYMITIAYDMVVAICTVWKKELKAHGWGKIAVCIFAVIIILVFLALLGLTIACGVKKQSGIGGIHIFAVIAILFVCTCLSIISECVVRHYAKEVHEARMAKEMEKDDSKQE